jgi:hypothetical protein
MSFTEVYIILTDITVISSLVPILFCVYKIRALDASLWALFLYFLSCFVLNVLLYFFEEKNQNIAVNIFQVWEFSVICLIYYQLFSQKAIKRILIVTWILFLCFAGKIFILDRKKDDIDDTVNSVESVLIIILTGAYFYKLFIDPSIRKLHKYHFFWINLSFLLYFSAALVLFLSSDFIANSSKTIGISLWTLHHILDITTNILMCIGIWNLKPISPSS